MLVSDLLRQKGHEVVTVSPGATASEALSILVGHRIGSLVVVEDGLPVGILTERDFLRLSYELGESLKQRRVSEIMTRNLLICLPTDSLDYAMGIMTENRLRHLPVVDKQRLVGLISIGDVVKALLRETQATKRYLEDYITGS